MQVTYNPDSPCCDFPSVEVPNKCIFLFEEQPFTMI